MAGQGLGFSLLAAAALRCLRIAAEWYAEFGAEPLRDRPITLVMPLATFASRLKALGLL